MRVSFLSALIGVTVWASGASAQPEGWRVVRDTLNRCVDDYDPRPAAAPGGPMPPGLISGIRDLSVAPMPGFDGTAFSYQGYLGSARVCGIALYGRVDEHVRREILKVFLGVVPMDNFDPSFWAVTAPPAKARYRGVPTAPGLKGLLWLVRPSSPNAPSVDFHYHVVAVQ